MDIYLGLPPQPLNTASTLTIGNFDGVHRGHQALVSAVITQARSTGSLAGLLTFDPAPIAVLRPQLRPLHLTTTAERCEILRALGLDYVVILPFTRETAELPAEVFVRQLRERLNLRGLWVGPDFALGRQRTGDAMHLRDLGEQLGFAVETAPTFVWQGEPVHSSRVRQLLQQTGDVAHAEALLGRPYEVRGHVVHGASRGRRLGFPTANLLVEPRRLVPAYGVYACWAWLGDRGYPAVVNAGVRPSFDNGSPSLEAHLLGWSGDIYGEPMSLSFVQRLRGEHKFPDVGALAAQIRRDCDTAATVLSGGPDTDLASQAAWSELPHTADRSLSVCAPKAEALFAGAARAVATVQGVNPQQPVNLARSVALTADGYPELLVAWLNTLLSLGEANGELYSRFAIQEISDRGLRAHVHGYPGYAPDASVKAATYYDLEVRSDAGSWSASFTIDV
jgi:riboflavin kinase/FMN adenylyltransferase